MKSGKEIHRPPATSGCFVRAAQDRNESPERYCALGTLPSNRPYRARAPPMTIRLRILTLLSLLSLVCIGVFAFFSHAQEKEEADDRRQRAVELSARLQRLVSASSRPMFRYLSNYAGRTGMAEFLAHPDPAWAEKQLRDPMDSFWVDSIWVLTADGRLLYAAHQPAGTTLTTPPLPAGELQPWFRKNQPFSFHAMMADGLYQIQGMPIAAADHPSMAAGWLLAARQWDRAWLEDLTGAGRGRVALTAATRPPATGSGPELAAWLPLLDHRGRAIAGLDYRVQDLLGKESPHEKIERALFMINSVGVVLLVGVLLHYWILRPFSFLRASLLAGDPAPLAPLLPQKNEFGQVAGMVQSGMRDRARLEQSLAERVRLARELHDGAIQGVYGAGMALSRVQALMRRDLPAAHQLLDDTRAELNRIIGDLRGHINQADPRPLDSSFGEAVTRLIQQFCTPVATDLDIDETVVAAHAPLFRSEVLQLVREAVSNALRHGRPSRLAVSWRRTPAGSTLVVSDDGVGFDPQTVKPGGRGLGNLHARAASLGGRLEIKSNPGEGTRVCLQLPMGATSA
jgi:signal transduction histidine kinase